VKICGLWVDLFLRMCIFYFNVS